MAARKAPQPKPETPAAPLTEDSVGVAPAAAPEGKPMTDHGNGIFSIDN